jgi:CRP-like cAMP-binding protein
MQSTYRKDTMITPAKLHKAEATYKRSLARTEELRGRRDAAIRAAVAEGTTQAEIARILGVTRAHIGHIMERTGR